MFTGIVAARGVVKRAARRHGSLDLDIHAPSIARELKTGDSIAVNGVCLTATAAGRRRFSCHATQQTLRVTTLGGIARGDRVNLELPARLSDRLGGHLVQGHVDGIATIAQEHKESGSRALRLAAESHIMRYVVPRGSVALDGVSLTVVDVGRTTFDVRLIPHTLEVTTMGQLKLGSKVNVEVDLVAKYIERLACERN